MFRNVAKIGLIVALLGFAAEDANAIGHPGGYYASCSGCGCGGWYSGPGGAFAYAEFGGPGGWGAPGCGYTGGEMTWCACPVTKYVPSPTQTASVSVWDGETRRQLDQNDQAMLTVNVPADAKVFVNGQATTSTGKVRQYTSVAPMQNEPHRYQVRVECVREGKQVSYEKTVSIAAGRTGSLSFSATPEAQTADKATSTQR